MRTQRSTGIMTTRDRIAGWFVGIILAIGMPSIIVVANAATGE